jgi:transposase
MKASLPIRKRLSALTCIKAGPKAVLIEVCELHENGGRGCFVSNDALSKKLGVSVATVTRTVASLTAWGLLAARVVASEGNRRYLAPTAAVRVCYAAGAEAEQLAAVADLTIVKSELTIVKTEVDYSQNGEMTIVKNEADYSQNASRVIGEDQKKTILEAQLKNLREGLAEVEKELVEAQKKITELEAENEKLRTLGGAAGAMTSQQGGRWSYDPAAISESLVLPFETPEFRQVWVAYRTFREEDAQRQLTGGMQEQEMLRKLSNLAEGDEQKAIAIITQTIAKGWKDLYKLDEQRPSNKQPGQLERGAKPTAAASTGARALSAQLRAIREERSAQNGSHVHTGAAAGTHAGLGSPVPPGIGAS